MSADLLRLQAFGDEQLALFWLQAEVSDDALLQFASIRAAQRCYTALLSDQNVRNSVLPIVFASARGFLNIFSGRGQREDSKMCVCE